MTLKWTPELINAENKRFWARIAAQQPQNLNSKERKVVCDALVAMQADAQKMVRLRSKVGHHIDVDHPEAISALRQLKRLNRESNLPIRSRLINLRRYQRVKNAAAARRKMGADTRAIVETLRPTSTRSALGTASEIAPKVFRSTERIRKLLASKKPVI